MTAARERALLPSERFGPLSDDGKGCPCVTTRFRKLVCGVPPGSDGLSKNVRLSAQFGLRGLH